MVEQRYGRWRFVVGLRRHLCDAAAAAETAAAAAALAGVMVLLVRLRMWRRHGRPRWHRLDATDRHGLEQRPTVQLRMLLWLLVLVVRDAFVSHIRTMTVATATAANNAADIAAVAMRMRLANRTVGIGYLRCESVGRKHAAQLVKVGRLLRSSLRSGRCGGPMLHHSRIEWLLRKRLLNRTTKKSVTYCEKAHKQHLV